MRLKSTVINSTKLAAIVSSQVHHPMSLDLELVFMYHRLYRGGRVHRSCVNEGSGSREEESDHNVVSALAGKASRLVEANARHVESKATSVEAQTPRPSLWTR